MTLHPAFMRELSDFTEKIAALTEDDMAEKPEGDRAMLLDAIPKLANAVEFFDSVLALEILAPLTACSYGLEMDKTLSELVKSLEGFDFDGAAAAIERIETALAPD